MCGSRGLVVKPTSDTQVGFTIKCAVCPVHGSKWMKSFVQHRLISLKTITVSVQSGWIKSLLLLYFKFLVQLNWFWISVVSPIYFLVGAAVMMQTSGPGGLIKCSLILLFLPNALGKSVSICQLKFRSPEHHLTLNFCRYINFFW